VSEVDGIEPSRRNLLRLALPTAAAAIGATVVSSCQSKEETADLSTPSEADVGFCIDMSVHHGQALVMCQRVLGQSTGASVQAAAAEVLQNQAIELGMMRAWLADWGESTAPPETVMAWMGNGDSMALAMMPGDASDAELTELATLQGRDQGRRWLELMMAHHQGGVAMADAAVELASLDKVVRLAATQSVVQSFEIEQYQQLLATDYA